MKREDAFDEPSVPIMGREEESNDIEPTDADILEIEAEGESDLLPADENWDELAAPAKDDLVAAFFADMQKFKVLPHEEQNRLAKILRGHTEGDPEKAFHDLTNTNLSLVVSIAKKHVGRGLDFIDLISEGIFGLMHALKKFEYERGYRLSTYASWWIRQKIDRAIKDNSRTIRLPVHIQESIGNIFRACKDLHLEGEIEPDITNIALKTGLSAEKIQKIMSIARSEIFSLQLPIGDDGSELGDFLCDEKIPLPDQAVETVDDRNNLLRLLATLTPREEKVLMCRIGLCPEIETFGLDGVEHTLEEVGVKPGFKVTRERIRQIETRGIKKLQHRSREFRFNSIYNPDKVVKELKKRRKKQSDSMPKQTRLYCTIHKPPHPEKPVINPKLKKGENPVYSSEDKQKWIEAVIGANFSDEKSIYDLLNQVSMELVVRKEGVPVSIKQLVKLCLRDGSKYSFSPKQAICFLLTYGKIQLTANEQMEAIEAPIIRVFHQYKHAAARKLRKYIALFSPSETPAAASPPESSTAESAVVPDAVSADGKPGSIERALQKIGKRLDALAEGEDASESISFRCTITGSGDRKYRVVIDEMRPAFSSEPASRE